MDRLGPLFDRLIRIPGTSRMERRKRKPMAQTPSSTHPAGAAAICQENDGCKYTVYDKKIRRSVNSDLGCCSSVLVHRAMEATNRKIRKYLPQSEDTAWTENIDQSKLRHKPLRGGGNGGS